MAVEEAEVPGEPRTWSSRAGRAAWELRCSPCDRQLTHLLRWVFEGWGARLSARGSQELGRGCVG